MKFEDIKEGDVVYIQQGVSIGMRAKKYFYVPKKVIRVTKTRFKLEDDSQFKKDGRAYGDSWTECYQLGETPRYSTHIVTDQSAQMAEFIEKQKLSYQINADLKAISINRELPMSLDDLKAVAEMIEVIKSKLKN